MLVQRLAIVNTQNGQVCLLPPTARPQRPFVCYSSLAATPTPGASGNAEDTDDILTKDPLSESLRIVHQTIWDKKRVCLCT
jgi:hypothetical protein